MPLMTRVIALFTALAAPLLLAACADPPPLYVDQAYVRVNPNPEAPSAGYFVVHGGEAPVDLRGVLSDRALRIEMHESVDEGGMMKMKPVDAVAIPARTEVAFAPGGKHIMLFGINPEAVAQGTIPLTFLFSNGDRIIVDTVVQKPAGAAPAAAGNAAAGAEK